MIFCFSGTGNSAYAAEVISKVTGDGIVSVNSILKKQTAPEQHISSPVVFCVPTYAWRMPRLVKEWILKNEFPTDLQVWFVMTCGSEIGNAAAYNRQLCGLKHWQYMGTVGVKMPENYIAMFSVPTPARTIEIVAEAKPVIIRAATEIQQCVPFSTTKNRLIDHVLSGCVNGLFYRMCVKSDLFYATNACVGCGHCALQCPLDNILLKEGKPTWGKDCTHCMACINSCPAGAIEYSSKSVGKPRYRCPKV